MTRRVLRGWVYGISAVCLAAAAALGWWMTEVPTETGNRATAAAVFAAVFVVVPAAVLAFCFQQRTSYLQQLRALWSKSIEAGQAAILATIDGQDNVEAVNAARAKVSTAIDEVRGVFKRIGPDSAYPYEPIKDIYDELGIYQRCSDLGQREATHRRILDLWKLYRDNLLKEFDTARPTFPVTVHDEERNKVMAARETTVPSANKGS